MKNILKEILSTSIYILTVLVLTYLIIHFVGTENGSHRTLHAAHVIQRR